MISIFTPNKVVSTTTKTLIITSWAVVLLVVWSVFKPTIFPSPLEIIAALPTVWSEGIAAELWASLWVNIEALGLSTLLGLPLSYLFRIPAANPAAAFVSKLRFIGPAVFFLPLLFLTSNGHQVKVLLITLGELFYFVTTMSGVVGAIPEYRFDDARTLRMSEWLSVWYVVIRGTLVETFNAIRDNAAMGWAMLMFVEGVVRSEGGVGVMLLNQEKHVNLANVWAIIIVIFLTGIVQDYIINLTKEMACPYDN